MENLESLTSNSSLLLGTAVPLADQLNPSGQLAIPVPNPNLALAPVTINITPLISQPYQQEPLTISSSPTNLTTEPPINQIVGTPGRDNLIGTDGRDRFTGGQGADNLTGGLGADIFVYESLRDAGDTIKDFTIGEDKIDLTVVLQSVGYNKFDPLGDGYIDLSPYSGGTIVLLDSDGKGNLTARPYIYVQPVTPAQLTAFDFLPNPGKAPQITANLVNDTGISNSDRLTYDPRIQGQISYSSPLTSVKAQLNSSAVEILSLIQADGKFLLTTAQLTEINGGSLPDGNYSLKLTAQDNKGNISAIYSYDFSLDRLAPNLSLNLATNFDSEPVGDLKTTFETVILVGTTEANLTVRLGGLEATANGLGEFSFSNQLLNLGNNNLSVSATDLAGNVGTFSQNIERLPVVVNQAPTGLILSKDTIAENSGNNFLIGTLSTLDPDVGDSHNYSLVTGQGDTDNSAFTIVGNELRVKNSADFETQSSYSIRVRTTDVGGLTYDQIFTVKISNVNESPQITLPPKQSVLENNNLVIQGINISDVDAQNGDLEVVLIASNGVISLNQTNGLTFINGDGISDSKLVFRSSLVNLNNALNNLIYSPILNFVGNDTISLSVNDLGNTGSGEALSETGTIAVTVINDSILLQENSIFAQKYQQNISITAASSFLSFAYNDLTFDTTDTDSINDAFEVALVDAQGNSLIHTIKPNRDAFFNITEGQPSTFASGVSIAGMTVKVNLTGVTPGDATLIFRLVNNDSDTQTSVRINNIQLLAGDGTIAPTVTPEIEPATISQIIDFSQLSDVSSSLNADYLRTSFNQDNKTLYADFVVLNQGEYVVDSPLVVAIKSISEPTVQVVGANGLTPEGLPYYNLSNLVNSNTLDPLEITQGKTLAFLNPQEVQFTYELVFLGKLNTAPNFISDPDIEGLINKPYIYDADATDLEGDTLTYSLLTAPNGMTIESDTGKISWTPGTNTVGNYSISVQVKDGRGGIDQQDYTLSVIAPPPNRPPIITSIPVVDARVSKNKSGKIIVANDEWTLSDFGFSNAPEDAKLFAQNIADYFTGGEKGSFLGYSNNFSFTASKLAEALTSDGHQWTVNTNLSFTLETLQQYDGVFVGGFPAKNQVLIDYVNQGGNVYLLAGTGTTGTFIQPGNEANAWKDFLNNFGLSLANQYNNIQGTIPINPSPHPIFSGIKKLYQNNGNTIIDLDTNDNQGILIANSNNGQGLYAVYDPNFQAKNAYIYDVEALDPDSDILTYELVKSPTGMWIEPETGIIRWLPTANQIGLQDITVKVSDGKGGIAEQKYQILVQQEAGNTPPVIITDPVTKVYPISSSGNPQLFDLSKWTIVQYDLTVQDPNASWQIQPGNTVVEQKINADASILLSNVDVTNNRIEGTWRVGTSDDDDYIGFVFGYQDPQHFYLFNWKQADQNEPSLGFAERGMSIKVVDANSSLTGTDLWPTNGNGQRVKQLFHNTVAWKDLTDYKFTLDFLLGQFTITVKEGNTIIDSVTINDNTYTSGKFGFYNYSQSNVLYSGFSQQALQAYNYLYDVNAIDADQDKLTYSLIDKPTGMVINPDTGLITWAATSQSNPINVEVKVEDGRGGFDTQSFIIELADRNVDLTLADIDTKNLVIDGQLLTVSGQVSAQIKNQGLNNLSDGFKVVFFEDRNINQAYDVGIDTVLGEAKVNTPLQAGQSTTVTTNLSGFLSFINSPIWGFVDADKVITETNENNNLAFSSQDCIIQPSGQFNPVVEWNKNTFSVLPSSNQVMMTPAVIDLNGDKIPDIVFSTFTGSNYTTDGKLRAISGANGSELWTVTNSAYEVRGASGVAVGDIDNDGKPEILATAESGDALIAFEHDGTFKWRSPAVWGGINWGSASIADLNQDGTPEIIIGATALDNQGRILWQGNSVGGLGRGDNGAGSLSIVADLDLDGSPEVIAGRSAYRANGSLYWNASINDGFAAIGNFDSDPNPEIVIVSGGKVYLLEHTGQVKWGGISIPGGGGGGTPTIADIDGDGQPEIGVAGANRYVVFETDGSIKWTSVTQDNSSNVTGSSVFDFNGDGKAEIVYGDELYLRIYNGSDGKILYQLPKGSGTTYELPLIVDVDADGNAEIVAIANNYAFGSQTGIFVIGDLNDTWVSTRQIWNQHSYHITNINDDGSIPIKEANSWQTHNTYRLNLQTNYSPLAAPDLTASYLRTEEVAGKTTIKARIGNGGSIFVASGVNVAFYKGDPKAGGVLLGTTKTTQKLEIGGFEDVSLTVNATSLQNIWVVADDDGTGKGQVNECDEENNRYSEVFVNGRGEIRGIKWHDLDEDGILNDEPGLANVIVYLDLNNNGLLDSNEPSQITAKDNPNTLDIDETGQYRFTNLSTGIYIVREIISDQWKQTYPNNPNPFYTVAVAQGEIVKGINFGNVEKNSSRKTFIFTKDADWNLGVLTNINYQTPNNNQLQLDPNIETIFNHIWVSLSGRDAVAKINTDYNDLDDGRVDNNNFTAVLGEYLTRPNGMQGNPSRTTVDRNGDVWVGNRNENGLLPNVNGVLIPNGSATKISANVTGSNTSTGVWNATTGTQGTFDRRAWSNTGGVDTNGGTDTASDSAILQYVRLPNAEAVRHVSVDANNNVWVGGYPFATRNFYLLDGDSGNILDSFNASNFGAGGYGGLIDSNGVLWSASLSQNALLRYDPVTRVGKKIAVPNSYGLGIDSNGFIWNADANNKIYKIDPSGNIVGVFATGGIVSTGVAVTLKDNHIWIANRSSNTITRLDNNGRLLASISVGGSPTGLSVDSNGKVWVTNVNSDNVMRIDPATNKVDLTIYLGSNADPYNYSDMTGSVLTGITIPTGIWRTVVDGEQQQRQWGVLRWNTEAEALISQGGSIKVEVRVADTVIGLDNQMWQAFDSGEILNLAGRYAEIRATLTKGTGINQISPILSDIRLSTAEADIPNIAPLITSLPSEQIAPNRTYKYQIQASDADNDNLTYSLLKLPNGMTLDRNLLTWTPTLDQLGEHPIEIQVTDGKGGEAIQRFIITVTPSLNNQAPVITSKAPNTAYIDDLLRYNVKATDAEGDRLTFELALLKPQGMAIDPTTGVLIWTPTLSQIGLHDVILGVKDSQGAITLQSFQLNVPNFNNVPIITSNPDLEAIANLPYQYQVEAQDSDGDSLSYRLENAPNGMTIDADTGLLTWTANNSQIGQIPVTIIVKDSQGAETRQTYTLNVVATAPNNTPEITSTPRNSVALGTSYFYTLNISDPDGDPLALNLQTAPTGMTLNQQGFITWTPEANQLGNHTVKVQVNDGRGGFIEQEWAIAVVSQRSNNQAPQILSTPSLKANINQVYQYNLVGNDPDGDPIFWSLETRPQGMSLDVTKGTIRWQPKLDQIGLHEVVIQAIDTQGATTTQRFTLAVNGVNLPPSITSVPLTRTVTNQPYTYTVVAKDPENGILTYNLGRKPNGMTIDRTGKIQWTPTQIGNYDIDVLVTDNQGATTTQNYQLVVGTQIINQAPNITSTPLFIANVGNPYQYQIQASDPDGQSLTYQLIESPQGMTINTNTGLVQWNTPITGNYKVVVAAFDSLGLGVTQGYNLTAKVNSLPVIRSTTPPTGAVPGVPYRYDIQANDPDGGILIYSLDTASQAKGITVDEKGRLTWTPSTSQTGTHTITITITDAANGKVNQSFNLTVAPDTTAPKVIINRDKNFTNKGESVSFQVSATDNVGITNLQLLINNTPVVLDSNGVAVFTPTNSGVITAKAIAFDAAGNKAEATTNVNVLDPTDTEAPSVSLDLSGIANFEITAPTPIKGTVNDTNLAYYALEVAPADGSAPFKEMFRGTTPVTNGVLGVLDPTLLPNDTYQVRLVAYDVNGKGNGVAELLDVSGDLKLGNFQLSFTDLEIPVGGIPITLTRTYNTLNSNNKDDFGYGWRMEFRDADVRTSLPKDELYQELGFRSVGFKEGDAVYLTLPGGKREKFTFKLESIKVMGIPLTALMGNRALFVPKFVADKGSTSTLSVETAGVVLIRGQNGQVVPFSGGSAFAHYHPQDWGNYYQLTTKEGIVYNIDATTGDINSITNRNSDKLTFTDAGITSSNGLKVTFGRDTQGRITTVTDPMGKQIKYEYDSKGDLIKVTDRENNTTQFKYNNDQPHYLDEIIDPLGRTGIKNEYDENGRLTKVFNGEGKTVQLDYNPDNSLYTVKDPLGNATTYEYDLRGNIVSEIDANGGIIKRTYDDNNNLLSETNPEGEKLSYTYDIKGNKLSETDALGNVTRYTYNANNDLLTTTDALGNVVTNTYDSRGNLLSITGLSNGTITLNYNNNGLLTQLTTAEGTTKYEYDFRGNVTKEINPLGHEITYTYDGNGNRLTETRKVTTTNGIRTLVTKTEYDSKGNIIKVTDAEGNISQTIYDAAGQKIKEIDALGRTTKYVYSDGGQLLETIYPDATPNNDSDNPRTRKEYDAANRVTAEIDELGRPTQYQYDALGRLIYTIYPDLTPNDNTDNPRKETRYDKAGRVIAEVDERGNITRYTYDDAGRRTEIILPDNTPNNDADNPRIVVTYDALGRQISQTDPLGRKTQFVYDNLGRPTGQIFADNTSISSTFDQAGRVIAKIDQEGNKTKYEYNALGQLTAVIDALNNRTEYGYNELGNLITQKDAKANITKYEYDGIGRRIATQLPLNQHSTTQYDQVGNIVSTTDFNGEIITFIYDERNRLIKKALPNNEQVIYTYTLTGQRATETDGNGTITYQYDSRNRLLSRLDPDGVEIEYTYDAAGNRTSVTVPSGKTSYTFDEQNRLKTVTDPSNGVTTYTYDLAGNLIKTTLPNGTKETREYDLLNRLLYLENSNSTSIINSFRYTLDKVGNRLTVVEQDGRKSNYEYDDLYRLLKEEVIDGTTRTISYTYDAVSNRLTRNDLTRNDSLEGNTTYQYDKNDRLLEEVTNGVTTNYTYDNNGNALSKTTGTDKVNYQWDAENRLVGLDNNGDGVNEVTNKYDSDGIRISQIVNGEETRFLVDKNRDYAQVLEEYTPSKIIKASYIYGNDLISQLRNNQRSFYHVDGLGSTRALTDINGLVSDRYAYEAFGEIIKQLGNTQNLYLFAGEQRDPNLGLDYLRARYLDVNSGRFVSRDSFAGFQINPVTLHKYIYANNNSINIIDPTGLFGLGDISAALEAQVILARSAVGSGFAVSRAAGGIALRNLGLVVENAVGRILSTIPNAAIQQGRVLVGAGGRRVIDFWVEAAGRVAAIEVKYGLPRQVGPALTRLVGQLETAATSSVVAESRAQIVLFTFRAPTAEQTALLLSKLSPQASSFTHISGFLELAQWIRSFFILVP